MTPLSYLSLATNILVLLPICIGMLRDAPWVAEAWGDRTPARSILFSIYLAILATSIVLLFLPDPKFVAALLFVQVVYKMTTPFTVANWRNPVVVSNLLIAALHLAAIFSLSGALT